MRQVRVVAAEYRGLMQAVAVVLGAVGVGVMDDRDDVVDVGS